jgi:predicted nucleotidyltransferase
MFQVVRPAASAPGRGLLVGRRRAFCPRIHISHVLFYGAEDQAMNIPDVNRSILRMHIAAIEAKHPIKILGLLPRGSAAHIFADDALDFLAEKRPGLDLLGLAQAQVDLRELLGRPVGIVLVSGLKGREAQEFPRLLQPI